jgi:serine/threonine protein kinase/tetratricopeptide (TPR) repeat protein
MSDERWQRLKRVFHDALEQAADARGPFLDRECAGDADLRAEIDSLLSSHDEADGFLSRPAMEEALHASPPTLEGRRVGAYRILGEIGRGGMGVVYRAVRDDDAFQKTVAVKVVRGQGGWGDVEQRLERERQILARLQHPNIAAVFDGGTTDEGQPYLVMELVEGRPITEYCAAHALGTRARLAMVRAVCDAVQYAHRNLVVHRDLKPGNILVGEDGRPKLLDFGIAKLLAAGVDPDVAPTATLLPMMTPEYASPEQVRGEAVTTSSDIYSLGVVLYELLTGQRPYAVQTDSLEGIVRAVCENAPALPSTVVRSGDVSLLRPALPGELRGDLDTIVLKALRKEPTRRYLTVHDLSEDIRRHLEGLPVLARADTFGYRVSKFTRRHKAAVATAVLVSASLVGGIVATSRQARIAEENRQRAERRFEDVRKLAHSFLFEFHDAIKDLPGSTPAREIVVRRGLEYLDSLAAEAYGNPSLQLELASAYEKVGDLQGALGAANLGQTPAAHRSYARAVELREAVAAAGPPPLEAQRDLAMARKRLATMRLAEGDWAGATGLFEQVRSFHVSLAAQRPDDFAAQIDAAGGQVNVGIAWAMSGRRREGLDACEEGLAAVRKLSASAASDTQLKGKLGVAWIWVGNIASAIPEKHERGVEAYREAATLYAELAAAQPDNAFWRLKLGDSHIGATIGLAQLARWDEALGSARQAEEIYSGLESVDPKSDYYRQERVAAQWLRARALLGRGDLGSTEPLLLEAERVMLEQHASQPENVLLRERLAGVQADRGRYHQLRASRSEGSARTRHLQMALEWMRKAERHLDELHAQHRLPMGSTEELEMVRRSRAECEAALGMLGAAAAGPS